MTPRLCGACLPDGARPVETDFGVCPECGLRTILAKDGRAYEPVSVPRPRSVPPASGLRKWWRGKEPTA